MANYNLPAFGPSAPFPAAPDPGIWVRADGTLKQLGQSLRLETSGFTDPDEPIRAIPDPWAQARTFGEALLDSSHSMHAHALGQWRGLLAMFALAGLYQKEYVLSPRQVPLSGGHIFERVLTHLSPQVAMGGQTALWNTPWLVMIQPQGREALPLAMTNPICLVSPGRQSLRIDLPRIAWAKGGIDDPLKLPDAEALTLPELAVLEGWLRKLRDTIEPVGGDVCGKIRQLLQEYADACHAESGDSGLDVRHGDSVHQELPPLFRPLWGTTAPPTVDDPAKTSRTRLRLDPVLALGPLKGVILVDKSLAERPGFSARRTFVWGTRTLGELLNSDAIFNATREEAASKGWWLVRADDLFTERAVRLRNEPLIASHPAGMQDMLLPFRPLSLMLSGALRDLASAQTSPSRASVTLRVKLDDASEAGAPHDITRHYASDPQAGEPLLVNDADWSIYMASVWPNFRSSAWTSYLARFTYPAQRKASIARPDQALSAALMASEIAEAGEPQAAIARACDLNAGKPPNPREGRFLRSEKTSGGEYEDVQFSALPFDALFYKEALGDRGEAAGGMVLLDLPVRETRPNPALVAIDFGTTNTVACFEDRQPIAFQQRLVMPVVFKDAEKTRSTGHGARWLLSKFLPPEARQTPTPTVALTRTGYPNQEPHWAFRNIVYFHSNQRHADDDEGEELGKFSRTARDAKFNLKWSEDPAHAQAATDFLEQFMIMVAAEAAADGRDPRHLRWRFSIPDSLAGRRRESFEGHLRAITRRISTGIANERDVLAPLYSEGLSAARYILADAGFNPQSLNMVLDIGGGTTDVTIWDIDQLRWKGSFLIAGQNFFTRTISQNPEILGPIGLPHWQTLFGAGANAEGGVSKSDIPHLAEMLFSGPQLQQAIDTHWDTKLNIGAGTTLRLTSLTFLGGLAWYLGLVVRQLVADGIIEESQLERPSFALCGRGAGIFKKMHGGRYADEESDVTRALQVFGAAAGLRTRPMPQLFTTPDAKLEVVRGMVADDGMIDASARSGKSGAADYLPAGIGLNFASGAPLHPDTLTDRSQFADRVRDVDLASVTAFLGELERLNDIRINLFPDRGQGAHGQIQEAVRKSIDRARTDVDANRGVEPPFITALRALVDELANPAEMREKRLMMAFTS